MQSIAEILTNHPYATVNGRRQPKCRLIPPGSRLIRIA